MDTSPDGRAKAPDEVGVLGERKPFIFSNK